jgi:hypothetical protein
MLLKISILPITNHVLCTLVFFDQPDVFFFDALSILTWKESFVKKRSGDSC